MTSFLDFCIQLSRFRLYLELNLMDCSSACLDLWEEVLYS